MSVDVWFRSITKTVLADHVGVLARNTHEWTHKPVVSGGELPVRYAELAGIQHWYRNVSCWKPFYHRYGSTMYWYQGAPSADP